MDKLNILVNKLMLFSYFSMLDSKKMESQKLWWIWTDDCHRKFITLISFFYCIDYIVCVTVYNLPFYLLNLLTKYIYSEISSFSLTLCGLFKVELFHHRYIDNFIKYWINCSLLIFCLIECFVFLVEKEFHTRTI